MRLDEAILAHKPDLSGSRAAKGHDFQRDWAFCLLVKLHEKRERFLMLFDYHDDVVILNTVRDPSAVTFYQVKSRDDRLWNLNDFIGGNARRKRGAPPKQMALPMIISASDTNAGGSILGKLYANKHKFDKHDVYLCFVSNRRLGFALGDGRNAHEFNEVGFDQLSKSDKSKIVKTIREELDLNYDPSLDNILRFDCTPLSSQESSEHAVGVLEGLLSKEFSGRKFATREIYDRIMREIRRKNNFRWLVKDYEQLCRLKGLGDNEFTEMIIAAVEYKDPGERWKTIMELFTRHNEDVSSGIIIAIEEEWKRYAMLRTDSRNPLIQWLRIAAADFSAPYVDDPGLLSSLSAFMRDGLDHLRNRIDADRMAGAEVYQPNEYEMRTALLYEFQDGRENRKLQKAYPQSAETATGPSSAPLAEGK